MVILMIFAFSVGLAMLPDVENTDQEQQSMASKIVASLILICAFLMGLIIYFVPSIVAWKKRKKNRHAILALNFFTGWTFIGWVGALVWSFTVDSSLCDEKSHASKI